MKSLLKAIAIVESCSSEEGGLTLTEISVKVGIPKTTAQHILTTLKSSELLMRDSDTGKYRIGPLLYKLGHLYVTRTDLLKSAEPVMKILNELTNECIVLTTYDRGYITYVMKKDSQSDVRFSVDLGIIRPAYSTAMGKAFLSELTEAELNGLYPTERLTPVTKKTVKTKTKLKLQLERIKTTGVSYSAEEGFEGTEGFASLIRNSEGRAVAAICISIPIYRSNENLRERLSTLVKMGATLISYHMGYIHLSEPFYDITQLPKLWKHKGYFRKAGS